jgi:hypothetical protein
VPLIIWLYAFIAKKRAINIITDFFIII